MQHERRRPVSPILWVLAVGSFILNLLIMAALIKAVLVGRQMAATMADQLDAMSQQSINYTFHLSQTVPVHTSVPFSYTAVVPFNQVIPISTSVWVTKELPVVGQIAFDVPIQAAVPISLSIPIQITRTIDVNADVPLDLSIPLQIALRDTPLKGTLDNLITSLNALAGR